MRQSVQECVYLQGQHEGVFKGQRKYCSFGAWFYVYELQPSKKWKKGHILLMQRTDFSQFDLWSDTSVCSGRKFQLDCSKEPVGMGGRKLSGHAMGRRRRQRVRIQDRNESHLHLCCSAILMPQIKFKFMTKQIAWDVLLLILIFKKIVLSFRKWLIWPRYKIDTV